MKIVEVIKTKKEAFTVFEDGHITRKIGKFTPTPPQMADKIPLPPRPTKLSKFDMVSSFWGMRIFRKNYAIWSWEKDCQKIKERNDYNDKLQKKALKEKMFNEAILPTITALSSQDEEYIGVLGFDFILDFENNVHLIGYNHFFDDINVEFFTKGFNVNWEEIFDSTLVGDVFQKYEIVPKNEYMLTIRQNEKINFISAKTKNNLEKYLKELDFDLSEYQEAKKVWKY